MRIPVAAGLIILLLVCTTLPIWAVIVMTRGPLTDVEQPGVPTDTLHGKSAWRPAKGVALDVAVIVETRRHPYLIPVIRQFLARLPNGTALQVFHGPNNARFLADHLGTAVTSGRVALELVNHTGRALAATEYHRLLLSTDFWRRVHGERVLMFSVDSALCSGSTFRIEHFLHADMDFVGAPFHRPKESTHYSGGLSVRSRRRMIWAIAELAPATLRPLPDEDVWFTTVAAEKGLVRKAPYDIARRFAVETLFFPAPFGIYNAWAHLPAPLLQDLRTLCPEVDFFGSGAGAAEAR